MRPSYPWIVGFVSVTVGTQGDDLVSIGITPCVCTYVQIVHVRTITYDDRYSIHLAFLFGIGMDGGAMYTSIQLGLFCEIVHASKLNACMH